MTSSVTPENGTSDDVINSALLSCTKEKKGETVECGWGFDFDNYMIIVQNSFFSQTHRN